MKDCLLVFIAICFVTCSVPNEKTVEYYDNGVPKTSGMMKNGLKQGKWIAFKESGDTLRVEHFKDGLKHGILKVFYENADRLESTQQYLNDTIGGMYQAWNEQGILMEESYKIKGGVYHGTAKTYFENGVLFRTEKWKNGVSIAVKSHHPNGEVALESVDLINGSVQAYDRLGNLKYSIQRKNGETIDTLFKAGRLPSP
ncbi:MAG: hypothetical protein AAGA66_20140 [Bacteroidota bacterium]